MNSIKKNKRLLLERIVIALCIIFCLESGSVIYFFTVGGGSLQKNLELGDKYLLNMDYDGAITAFSKAIKIDGMNADAYIGRGDAYKAKGDYASAWADYEKAQELSGNTDLLRQKIGTTELTVVSGNGQSVNGAEVELTGDTHSYKLTTNSSGSASEILFPENYHVKIIKEDYEPFSTELSAENGGISVEQFEIKAKPKPQEEPKQQEKPKTQEKPEQQEEPKQVDYNQLYQDYARKLQSESSSSLFMKIFESDEPLLVIAENCSYKSYDQGEGYSNIVCKLYQYSTTDEQIVYIGELSSGGTATPLRWRGKSIQGGAHHSASSVSAKNGTGTCHAVYDAFLHDNSSASPEKAQLTVKNNTWEKTNSEKISMNEADSLWDEYYGNGNILFFDPVQ